MLQTAKTPEVCVFQMNHTHKEPYFTDTKNLTGNTVTSMGVFAVGKTSFQTAYAKTDVGATFPFQYHQGGGNEMAIILRGAGTIEVREGEDETQHYSFRAGDIVLIPPGIHYCVHNSSSECPLEALVFFDQETRSFWPDGRRA